MITASATVLGAVLGAIVPGLLHHSAPRAASRPTGALTRPALQPTHPNLSPTPATSPPTNRPEYLSNMAGQVTSDNSPQTNSWTMQENAYPHSIGYPGECYADSVNYDLKNTSYSWFDATVGVNDDADQMDQGTQVTFTVIVNPGNKQSTTTATWGAPRPIRIPIHGATMLTLETATGLGCLESSGSVAVWGNARLIP